MTPPDARPPLRLGCIADDFTGATDLANNLVRAGMRVVQTIGVPTGPVDDVDAVVVALKSRTIPAAQAVEQSLQALRWLQAQGCSQVYFKVCSTFDSTPQGNIGPVAEALLDALDAPFCCVTPAFPATGRTVYQGHLFVGEVLLSDSGMRQHPLTPMTDASLVRVLQAQCRRRVGLIGHATVRQGTGAIRDRMAQLQAQGVAFGIVDIVDDADLQVLGRALADAPLVVAGSGVAIGLPQNHGLAPGADAARLPAVQGPAAIVSGSCSVATNDQVQRFVRAGGAALAIDPLRIAAGDDVAAQALAWARARLGAQPVLVYSSASPEAVRGIQQSLGAATAGELVERTLAAVARGLVDLGVGRLIVAGGETSGAAVQALGVAQLRIGPQIDPGVPWCFAHAQACGRPVQLALKSGNFGGPDFFTRAFAVGA
ncbi:MAG TPA: 3-oxo-tetronate kinase [Ramlibacter sp.]|uniref:3-oxo-tetronate kinase n=1 Tax=Ramlibacter sp. TaxID=1917967 RepID=UPI002D4ED308|nr:3-oxo-tetronate kinase [Ramlibacter sp.]HZY19014.1 3-oxo-tetronate kinase [Ramlibacter sp.]